MRNRITNPMVSIALLVLLCVTATSRAAETAPPVSAAAPQAEGPPSTTLAVLNFANRSPGDGWDWLGRGLADQLITRLSVISDLYVIDRDRMSLTFPELGLVEAGIVAPDSAGEAGRVCSADVVVFGSYGVANGRLTIEAHIVEVDSGKLMQVEVLEGDTDGFFDLERRLVDAFLRNMGRPLSEEDREALARLPISSFPAFEHYSRCLGHYDRGEWLDALGECRHALRIDPNHQAATMRLAYLYQELAMPKHAFVECRKLLRSDEVTLFPPAFLYRMGRLCEESDEPELARSVYEQVLAKCRICPVSYDLFNPRESYRYTPPSEIPRTDEGRERLEKRRKAAYAAWNAHEYCLRSLERLGMLDRQEGRDFDEAKRYSAFLNFSRRYGPCGTYLEPLRHRLRRCVLSRYAGLYWRFVAQNRDAVLCPCSHVHLLEPNSTAVDSRSVPTRGGYNPSRLPNTLSHGARCIAAPGFGISEITLTIDESKLKIYRKTQAITWIAQVKITRMFGDGWDNVFGEKRLEATGGVLEIVRPIDPGTRAIRVSVDCSPKTPDANPWRVSCKLVPWTAPAKPRERKFERKFGRLQISTHRPAHILMDGSQSFSGKSSGFADNHYPPGDHRYDVLWPDGRRASGTFHLRVGGRRMLVPEPDTFPTATVKHGSTISPRDLDLCLDRDGRLWLVWTSTGSYKRLRSKAKEDDLWCTMSVDGREWEPPWRLPVSSKECDRAPVMRQAPDGRFWLVWLSDRDRENPDSLWSASSADGRKWTFPAKVVLPGLKNPGKTFSFTIDGNGLLWLCRTSSEFIPARLFCSYGDGKWLAREKVQTGHIRRYGLASAGTKGLLIIGGREENSRGQLLREPGARRRYNTGAWEVLEYQDGDAERPQQMIPIKGGGVGFLFHIDSRTMGLRESSSDGGNYMRIWSHNSGWSGRMQIPKGAKWTVAAAVESDRLLTVREDRRSRCIVSRVYDCRLPSGQNSPSVPSPFMSIEDSVDDPNRMYATIDVSAGPDARSYPVQWHTDVPDFPSNRCKKTTICLRRLPRGSFSMGSTEEERRSLRRRSRFDDEVLHAVTLTGDFYIGVFEVTQKQWSLVMGANPSRGQGDSRPVESVSWNEVRGGAWPHGSPSPDSFIGRLRRRTGLALDLPTEAQWEYACRAGTLTALNDGSDYSERALCRLAKCNRNIVSRDVAREKGSHTEVGSYAPNAWGLYDMHGNVAELCLDWYGYYPPGPLVDPIGPETDRFPLRVRRGGSSQRPRDTRSAAREWFFPDDHTRWVGFRLAAADPLSRRTSRQE